MIHAGIDQVVVNGGMDILDPCHDNMLQWLLGCHNNIQLGLVTNMQLDADLLAAWRDNAMMPKLGSHLVTLDLCGTSDVWQALFQLQALTSLRLSVVSSTHSLADTSTPQSPAQCVMTSLEKLVLINCTASVSSLLIEASLPKLKNLRLETCNVPGGLNLELKPLAKLEELCFTSCQNITVKVFSLPSQEFCLLYAFNCNVCVFEACLAPQLTHVCAEE